MHVTNPRLDWLNWKVGVEACDQSKAGLLNSMEICGTAIVNPALDWLSHMILDLFSIASGRVFLNFLYILLVNFEYGEHCWGQLEGGYKTRESVKKWAGSGEDCVGQWGGGLVKWMENCGLGPCDQSSLGLVNSMQSCRLEPCDQSKAGLVNSMENCELWPCDQSSLGLVNWVENCGVGPCDQSSLGLVNSMQRCGLEACDQSKAGLLNWMEIWGTADSTCSGCM